MVGFGRPEAGPNGPERFGKHLWRNVHFGPAGRGRVANQILRA